MKYLHLKKKLLTSLVLTFLSTNIMADNINVESDIEASRFLTQATFGPTIKDIQELKEMKTYEKWVDTQIELPYTKMAPKIYSMRGDLLTEAHRQAVWWNTVINEKDQLRLRTAYALSQILVTGFSKGFAKKEYERTAYYDILIKNSFSKFNTLLKEVTLNPIMGQYLSMLDNKKAVPQKNTHPDENFAREIMQLFTIGLSELNPDGSIVLENGKEVASYTQKDIENLARVFTGWQLNSRKDYISQMKCNETFHDSNQKIILGKKIEAGLTCEDDLDRALQILTTHKNTSVFISKQLIQKLITSNPTPEYIKDISDIFKESQGDLKLVIKGILLHDEARIERNKKSSIFGKFKEPMIRLSAFYRATNTISRLRKSTPVKVFIGQTYLDAGSVFNYFRPTYKVDPSSIYVTPELQIATDSILPKTSNFLEKKIFNLTCKVNNLKLCIKLEDELIWVKDDVDRFINHYNLLLFAGTMSEEMKSEVENYIKSFKYPTSNKKSKTVEQISRKRASHALFLMMSMPEQNFQQ